MFAVALFAALLVSCDRFRAGEQRLGAMLSYDYYDILRVSDEPLFDERGAVNQGVLDSLLAILSDPRLDPALRGPKSSWPTGLRFEGEPYAAITAEDFSAFVVPEPESFSRSGAVAIRLFPTVPGRSGVQHGHLTELTGQWWQLVYRSAGDGEDALTLWMMQPYRLTAFNGTRYDVFTGRGDERFINRRGGQTWQDMAANSANVVASDERAAAGLPPCDNYFFEGNFSASMARSNLLRDFEALLARFDVGRYLVAPADLPGSWQSSRYQTGSNTNHVFYSPGQFYVYREDSPGSANPDDGLGASGLIWGRHFHFSLANGKDGLSVGPFGGRWPHTGISPTHRDLIWLPSDFETRSMGHNKERVLFQTFIADPGDPASPLRTNVDDDNRPATQGGRSGLWRLNGFDRAFDADALGVPRGWESQLVWLRSADVLGVGNANTIYHTGNRYGYGVNQLAGMRPALHLSLARLSQGSRGLPGDY